MNCSTDYNFWPWPGLQSCSLPEWNPMPDVVSTPQSVSKTVQLSETNYSLSKKLSKKKITKDAHKIQSSEKTAQCSKKHSFWTPLEDEKLLEGVKKYGLKRSWKKISIVQFSGKRTNKQCRDRYTEHLDPGLCHGPLTGEEIRKFIQIVDSLKKDPSGEFLMSAAKKQFNKGLEPGQFRSRDALKNLHQRLKNYAGRDEISSSVSTTSSGSLSEGSLPMQTSVAKNEIDIDVFIRDYEVQPAQPDQVKEETLQICPTDSTAASEFRWSKEEDAKLIKAVEEYGKKWLKISSLGILDRSPDQLHRRWGILKRKCVSRKRKSEPEVDREAPTKKQEISPTEFNVALLPELLEHKDNSSNLLNSTENLQLINTFLTNPQFFLSLISQLQQQGTMGSYGT